MVSWPALSCLSSCSAREWTRDYIRTLCKFHMNLKLKAVAQKRVDSRVVVAICRLGTWRQGTSVRPEYISLERDRCVRSEDHHRITLEGRARKQDATAISMQWYGGYVSYGTRHGYKVRREAHTRDH